MIEKDIGNITQNQRLLASVQKLGGLMESAESSGSAIGSLEAEAVIIKNIPVLVDIVDGRLKGARKSMVDGSDTPSRIAELVPDIIKLTQDRLDSLMSVSLALDSLSIARRLEPYLPVELPRTQAGFKTLKFIAQQFTKATQATTLEPRVNITEGVRLLDRLDNELRETALGDKQIVDALSVQAREEARDRVESSKIEGSKQISQIRGQIAQEKIHCLKREPVEMPGTHGYSRFEVLANQIIERDDLSAQVNSIMEMSEIKLESAKNTVLDVIARKRAIETVMRLIDQDPTLCQVLANRSRFSPEDLMNTDPSIKRQVANNALNNRRIVVSVEDRKVFDGPTVVVGEKARLTRELLDPLPFIARLTDEELAMIRQGIPKISSDKSVYDFAGDILRQELEDEVSDEEIIEVLTKVVLGEMISAKTANAIDAAIAQQGLGGRSLLEDVSRVANFKDEIVAVALKFLTADLSNQAAPVRAVTLTDADRRTEREIFVNSFRKEKLTRSAPSLDARVLLDQFVATPQTAMLGPVIDSEDIKSSLSPFRFLPKYKTIYPPVVIQALGNLFAEYNAAFRPLVAANREWETDYQNCILADGIPVNGFVQIDMVGLPAGVLVAAASLDEEDVREALRGRIFEIENSIAMYQYLENLFSQGDQGTLFKRQFFFSLDRIRQKNSRQIALLAVTDQKYQAMREIEFGKMDGEELSDEEVKALSGFDRFFSPAEFQKYLVDNKGQCEYLLYVRSSDPVAKMKSPEMVVLDELLEDDNLRRIVKANAITFNIDNPTLPIGDRRRINDTKEYMEQIGMAFTAFYGGDLISGGRLSADFETFIIAQGIDPRAVEAGKVVLRAKPMKGTYGGYGHIRGKLGEAKFRRELRRNLLSRGAYVVQPEMRNPIITNKEDGQTFVYIDRNFFSTDGQSYEFMGGVRTLMPVRTREAENNRIHGNSSSIYAEIS